MLKAEADRGEVEGQVAVAAAGRIRRVSLVPGGPSPPAEAIEALAEADQVVIGPGSLYTSVLAAVAVPGHRRGAGRRRRASGSTSATCAPRSPRPRATTWPPTSAALREHGVDVDVVAVGPGGRPGSAGRATGPLVDRRLAGPNGLVHDPARLADGPVGSAGMRSRHGGPAWRGGPEEESDDDGAGWDQRLRADRPQLPPGRPGGQGPTSRWWRSTTSTSAETNAHLLRYDSTQGRLAVPVEVDGDDLVVGGRRIRVLAEREPEALPWGDLGVEVVVESTGRFTARARRRRPPEGRGAPGWSSRRPSATPTPPSSSGVNDDDFDPDTHLVVSNASCTTNCFVPDGQGARRRLRRRAAGS